MEVLRFALLGLGIGALYALASQGLLVIYRGSGVLNFAQGAIGMVGAYLYWEMKVERGLPSPVAWIIAIAGVRAHRRGRPHAGHAPAEAGVAAGPHRGDAGHADRHPIGWPCSATAHG